MELEVVTGHTRAMTELPDHVAENRRHWDERAHEWVASGERLWACETPQWGEWGVPDEECPMLPDDMTGMDAIELGCGTGYVSAWMHRRGARVVGIDNSSEQLATARRIAADHGVDDIEWIHGDAENVPKPDESFDFAVSEYGAAIWCRPEVWIREAHRLLRPGGRLTFLGNSPLTAACAPLDGADVDRTLHRPMFEIGTLDWRLVEIDPGGVEFNMTLSGWFALFREVGFQVDDYREPRPAPGDDDTPFVVSRDWARDHPSEQVFFLTKR